MRVATARKERSLWLSANKEFFLSIPDFVQQHLDRYEDAEDSIDTLLEETDPEFQRSLKQGAREIKKGRYLTHAQLKLALANKKLR